MEDVVVGIFDRLLFDLLLLGCAEFLDEPLEGCY
jgi:hypothetical protein